MTAPGIVTLPGDPRDSFTTRVTFPQRSLVSFASRVDAKGQPIGKCWVYLEGGHRLSVTATEEDIAKAMDWLDE